MKLISLIRQNGYKVEMYIYAAAAVIANLGLLLVLWRISPSIAGPWQ